MGVLDHKDRTIISADTITDITTSPGFVEGYVPPRPTVEQLVRRNVARLERRVKRQRENAAQYNGEIKAFNRALRQAEEDLKDFRELAQNVPHGQRLAVVLEVPAPKENRRLIQQEYHHVRGPVLRLLAEECAQEVEAAGYDEHARMYMKKGRDPARAEGHLHDAGLDHIVSQSLCGLWGATRVKDPLRDDHVLPKFRVNHVDNMYLTPWEQHHRKNKFLALQCGLPFKENSRRFKIYPVPEVNEKSSGSGRDGLGIRVLSRMRKV